VDSQTIVISLDPAVTALLADNGLDLLTELRNQQLDVKRSPRPTELKPADPGTKSVELIILASAAAAPLVAAAITRVIDALGRGRKALVTTVSPEVGSPPPKKGPATQAATSQSSTHSTKVSFLGLKVELTDKYEQKP
jgi:hypothetical protein